MNFRFSTSAVAEMALGLILGMTLGLSPAYAEHDRGGATPKKEGTHDEISVRLGEREKQVQDRVLVILEYIRSNRKDGIEFPTKDLEKTLTEFETRLKKSGDAWAGKDFDADEASLLLDNMELLSDYTAELIAKFEADPTSDPAALSRLKALVAANIEKRWRNAASRKKNWKIGGEKETALKDGARAELLRRNQLLSGKSAEFEKFSSDFTARFSPKAQDLQKKYDSRQLIDELKRNPGQFASSKWKEFIDDVRQSNPARAKELEDEVERYLARARDLKTKIEKETRGRSAEEIGKDVLEEIKAHSAEVRKLEASLKEGVERFTGRHGITEADIKKELEDAKSKLEAEKKRLEGDIKREEGAAKRELEKRKTDLEKELEAKKKQIEDEARKTKERLEGLFKPKK